MNKKKGKNMKKKIIGIFICTLLIATAIPAMGMIEGKRVEIINREYNEIPAITADEDIDVRIRGGVFNFKLGLVFGSFESIEEEDGLLAITAGEGKLHYKFLFSDGLPYIRHGKKIKISEGEIGIITDNFIFAFCRIFMTRAQISMDVVSHDEQGNKVTWEVTEITGDSIWENNMCVYLNCPEFMYRSSRGKYLTAGDQIEVTAPEDGIYYLSIVECISRDILFSSGPVEY